MRRGGVVARRAAQTRRQTPLPTAKERLALVHSLARETRLLLPKFQRSWYKAESLDESACPFINQPHRHLVHFGVNLLMNDKETNSQEADSQRSIVLVTDVTRTRAKLFGLPGIKV